MLWRQFADVLAELFFFLVGERHFLFFLLLGLRQDPGGLLPLYEVEVVVFDLGGQFALLTAALEDRVGEVEHVLHVLAKLLGGAYLF